MVPWCLNPKRRSGRVSRGSPHGQGDMVESRAVGHPENVLGVDQAWSTTSVIAKIALDQFQKGAVRIKEERDPNVSFGLERIQVEHCLGATQAGSQAESSRLTLKPMCRKPRCRSSVDQCRCARWHALKFEGGGHDVEHRSGLGDPPPEPPPAGHGRRLTDRATSVTFRWMFSMGIVASLYDKMSLPHRRTNS